MTRTTRGLLLAALAVLLVGGLAWRWRRTPSPAAIVPVSGRMVFADDSPVSDTRISFVPRDQAWDVKTSWPFGSTDGAGRFTMYMDAKVKGAPPGRYGVMAKQFFPEKAKTKLSAQCDDPNVTPIEVVVPEAGSTELVIRVE